MLLAAFAVLSLSIRLRLAHAALVNLTIDDTDSAYFDFIGGTSTPPSWASVTPTTPCNYCSAQPNASFVHNSSWHDGSEPSAGSFSFVGTAVYIFGIDLAGANISFSLNDPPLTTFHRYKGTKRFVYDALFFSATGLEDGKNRTVSWMLQKDGETNGTVGLFDYAVITVDQVASSTGSPAPTGGSSSKSHTSAIAGGVVGGLLALALLAVGIFWFIRTRRRTSSPPTSDGLAPPPEMIQPFVEQQRNASAPNLAPLVPLRSLSTRPGNPNANGDEATTASGPGSGGVGTGPIGSGKAQPTSPTSLPYMRSDLSSGTQIAASNDGTGSDRATLAPTVASGTTMTGSAREQFLEDRLAILEAHVRELHDTAGILPPVAPPAYEHGSTT